MKTEPWSEIDAWRSIWEAIAIVNGDDPDVAVDGHRRLCQTMGWEGNQDANFRDDQQARGAKV